MTYTWDQAMADLDAQYARMPTIPDCAGHCWRTCHNISHSPLEQERVEHEHGIRLAPRIPDTVQDRRLAAGETLPNRCPALSSFGTCRVYPVRPFVCRLWGAADLPEIAMRRCPHGCTPERWMTLDEAKDIQRRIDAIGVRYYRENPS